MIASIAHKQLTEMRDQQAQSLVSKAKTEPLDTLRFEAGKLEGLNMAIHILEESNGETSE